MLWGACTPERDAVEGVVQVEEEDGIKEHA
jgi:hypothetical protein